MSKMDVPVQNSPPRKPWVPQPTHSKPAPSHPPPPSQVALPSQAPPPPRLGVLVEATQPFASIDNVGMLRWLLGGRVGGEDRVREVIVSQDRSRAIVEFVNPDPGVIQQLVSTSADLLDPLSKQPLRLTQIDLTTLCLVVTGFTPNVKESALESHFQGEANDQQIHSVQISADKESAMITFKCRTAAMELVGKKKQLFGVNLHLELGCNSTTNSAPACPTSTAVDSSVSLCVQGLPEAMLNNPQMVSEALKLFIKQGTGFEAEDCSIVQGRGYLTFTDPSAVQAIVNSPPTQTFMSSTSGSVLHMSATSQPSVPSQVPPTARREAWGVPDTPTDEQLSSPHLDKPVTAPVRLLSRPPAPHRRGFIGDGIQRQHQGDQYSHHQGQQQQQSYYRPIHHYASVPDSVGATTPTLYGPLEAAHHPPANAMATAPTGLCRKFKVSDLPKEARNLKLYFQSLAGPVASVEMFKDSAVITLENPTSMDRLLQLSRTNPLEGVVLALSALEPSDTVLVSGLNDTTPDVLVKLMLADYIQQHDSVKSVKRISPTHALVIFKSPNNVSKITSNPLIEVEGLQLSVNEHYPFMDISEILDPSSAKQDDPLKPNDPPTTQVVVHSPQRDLLTKEQHFYLKNSLPEFNDALQSLKACANIEKVGKDYFVVISPLEGSGSIDEWKDNVAAALKEHFEELSIETIDFPNKEAKSDIQDMIYDQMDSVLVVKRKPDSFVIAGSKEIITEICEKATEICLQYQVTIRAIELPRKRVKFLEKFYHHEFQKLVNKTSVHDIQFNTDDGLITVTANPNGHTEIAELVEQKDIAEEKMLQMSQAAYKLLSSQRGNKKLNKIFGVSGPQIVYDFEQVQIPGDVQYYICFLSKDAEVLKKVKESVKMYVHEVAFETSPAKIRLCSSKEWRLFIATLNEEHFVSVTAQEASSSIIVTGEKLACNGISKMVLKFLEKHTNIEERVTVSQIEWFVINGHFFNKVKIINNQAKKKQVKIEWPKPDLKVSSLSIVISGEPLVVDDIKVQVSMLLQKVCKKESRITGVPAVVHVLESMEDKLRLLESDERVRIKVTLENGDTNELEAAAQVEGELPRQVCAGTSPSGSRVSVYTGDFAQNAPVGVIVNFVTSDPNTQVGCLKHLLESGGADAMEDFKQKVSQFMELKPGTVFRTRHGQLKCSQLVHCVLPSWQSGTETNAKFIYEALYEYVKVTVHSGSILIPPLTSAPLHYPVNMFVRLVMDAVTDQTSSDLQVSVFVEELHHANEFQGAFQTRNYQIHQKVPLSLPLLAAKKEKPAPLAASVKTISSNLGNFITIVNGDLLQQQADVYINSTNTKLHLKHGQLSQLLLKACGDELQKECSEYAPLKPGQVAVTGAKNLKCNKIFHIALPRYKTANSERDFRETVRQILRTAKSSSVSSIAIPSLGVANLGYPNSVSAKILFQEVITFHSQYPSSIQKFIFVIYEKNVFQVFSKEFAQQMSGEATAQVPPTASSPAAAAVTPPIGSTTLIIAQGNIANESTDIIVNTTSEEMTLNKSAVSKAILEKAGDELQKTCKHYVENGMRLDHGQIVVTPAVGKLRCRKIIHAHVPHQGSIAMSSTHKLIEKIVIDCLQTAESEKMASISFPAFGLGGGGYSVEQVAEPMLKAFQKFGQTHPQSVKSIRVVIYDPELYKQFNDFYCKFFGRSSSDTRSPPSLWNRLVNSSHKVNSESQELQAGGVALFKASLISQSIQNSTVVFTIFAASNAQCEKIKQDFTKLINDMSTTKTITGAHIEQLIDDDVKDIFQIGDKHGVHVKMVAKIKEIHISGETSKVLGAHSEIQQILNDIEISMIELREFEWLSADDDGAYKPYPPEASMKLQRAFNKGLNAIELTVDNVVVVMDIQNKIETDKTNGKTRKIICAKNIRKAVQFPPTWETPCSTGGKKEPMTRIEVESGTPEYIEAVKEFDESLTKAGVKYSIEKVERIENITEYAKHVALKDCIREKHKKDPHMKRLFHGSRKESLEPIAVQGFNRNFAADANAAYYGRGVYFAVESSYSAQDKYSVPDSSGLRYMFVCRVIIGEYTLGNKDMKTAPPLTTGSNAVFDTLVENMKSPTIFVALTDAQAYPEYLITFKKL